MLYDPPMGIRDELQRNAMDESGRWLTEDRDSRPTAPPATDYFAWFKADALPGLNDSAVATWTDSGTGGNDLTSMDSSKTHLFLNSTPDGNGAGGTGPVVRWSGHATMNKNPTVTTAGRTGCTWLMVARRTSFTSFAGMSIAGFSQLTLEGALQTTISGSTVTLQVAGASPDLTINLGDWHVISLAYDQSENLQRVATNFDNSSGAPAGGGAGLIPLDALQLQHEFGEVKELIVFKRKLTDAELYGCRSYLARKYSIAIA